jgi:hypothetical protein
VPQAKIFGNPDWIGDSVSFAMKAARGEGEEALRRRLTDGEYSSLSF